MSIRIRHLRGADDATRRILEATGSAGWLVADVAHLALFDDDDGGGDAITRRRMAFWNHALQDALRHHGSVTGKPPARALDPSRLTVTSCNGSAAGVAESLADAVANATPMDALTVVVLSDETRPGSATEMLSRGGSESDALAQAWLADVIPVVPSHGIPEAVAKSTCFFAPFYVLQPRMHRRVPLDALRPPFRHAVTPRQLALEVLFKSGHVGKYGA